MGHVLVLETVNFDLAFPFLSSLTVTMLFSDLWQDCFSVSNLFFSAAFWHLDSSCAKSDFTVPGRQLLDVLHLINFAPNYKQRWPITKGINILVPWLSHHENGCLNKSSKSNYHIVCRVKCGRVQEEGWTGVLFVGISFCLACFRWPRWAGSMRKDFLSFV